MAYARNEGIAVSGGTFNATNVAAGRNAQVNQMGAVQSDALNQAQNQITLLLQALEKHANQIPNHEEVTQAAQSMKEELNRQKPNGLTLKSLMNGIADSVKSVSGVAIAVEGLKAAITVLLG
jgi:hypothetical protein